MVGAASAASFYAPIEKVKRWSWETTWAVAGIFSWVLLPVGVSYLLLPHFGAFYGSIETGVLLRMALFGAMWGVGNVSYGLTMRYLGMSLGIGVAIGVTLVVGTLIPPLLNGQAGLLFETRSGLLTMAGIVVALMGVAIVSYEGPMKEMQMKSGGPTEFNVMLGLGLAVMCGIFSSGMSFAMNAAKPMQAAALQAGVNPLYSALPSYVFIMGGGALVNFAYCFMRLAMVKKISLGADLRQPGGMVARNAALAATGGIMWYLQFFFYAWGAANIPERLSYVNWMLHMSGYVLFGGIVGVALGEWGGGWSR
jgi:L-rhamnose-H+ transport protein